MDTPESTTKVCCDCHQSFPRTLEYFPKESRNRDGLKKFCRTCFDARRPPVASKAVPCMRRALAIVGIIIIALSIMVILSVVVPGT